VIGRSTSNALLLGTADRRATGAAEYVVTPTGLVTLVPARAGTRHRTMVEVGGVEVPDIAAPLPRVDRGKVNPHELMRRERRRACG
jgi:hypothetical protein